MSVTEQVRFRQRLWRMAPRPLRRGLVALVGSTFVLVGFALVVLPGPFTLPLVLAGLAILSSEFAWAERILTRGRDHLGRGASAMRKIDPRRARRRRR